MRKYIVLTIILAAFASAPLLAQNTETESPADSVVYIPAASMDQALAGKDVFSVVSVNQSQAMANAMRSKMKGT